ncbi:hypothetical protein AMECASPLE_019468 [Ameca splendens]|uniref:Uncharacterized protein n=1 Tax=Ameca splendens TaxID=208324 RepID=A0ABV0Y2T3_9TELE
MYFILILWDRSAQKIVKLLGGKCLNGLPFYLAPFTLIPSNKIQCSQLYSQARGSSSEDHGNYRGAVEIHSSGGGICCYDSNESCPLQMCDLWKSCTRKP